MTMDLETQRKIWKNRRKRKKNFHYIRLFFAGLPLIFLLNQNNPTALYLPAQIKTIPQKNIIAHNTIALKEIVKSEISDIEQSEIKEEALDQQETKVISESYFDDAVFIGDSRTEGLETFSGLKNATFYAEKGLNVKTAFEHKLVKLDNQEITIPNALKKQSFGKVYIMFGVNELGWIYEQIFIERYANLIDQIKKLQPNAEIYIQSIIHVSSEREKKEPELSNKKINRRNKLLKKLAKEKKVQYINLNKVLTDKNGALFSNAATDGIHLNKTYCVLWKDYLMEYASNQNSTTTIKNTIESQKKDKIKKKTKKLEKKTKEIVNNTTTVKKDTKVKQNNTTNKISIKQNTKDNKKINNETPKTDLSKKFVPKEKSIREKSIENNKVSKNKPNNKKFKPKRI